MRTSNPQHISDNELNSLSDGVRLSLARKNIARELRIYGRERGWSLKQLETYAAEYGYDLDGFQIPARYTV